MDKPLTLRTGLVVTSLVTLVISLAGFVAASTVRQVEELQSRVSKVEGTVGLIGAAEVDIKSRLMRIEDKLDRLTEGRIR